MNGDACKFSHEPLTDESRQLLDKVGRDSFVCYIVSSVVDINILSVVILLFATLYCSCVTVTYSVLTGVSCINLLTL